MGTNSNANLPRFTSAEFLSDKFSNYFMRKATIIRNKLILEAPNTIGDISIDADIMFNTNMLEIFRPVSEVEGKTIINKSPLESTVHLDFEDMCRSTSVTNNKHCQQVNDKSVMPLCFGNLD